MNHSWIFLIGILVGSLAIHIQRVREERLARNLFRELVLVRFEEFDQLPPIDLSRDIRHDLDLLRVRGKV